MVHKYTTAEDAGRGGAWHLAREALRDPEFRALWLGQAVSQVGDGLTALAALVVVTRLAGSARAVATLAILITAPQLIFGLHAGVLVDRWDRRRIMIASDVARAALVGGVALAALHARLDWIYALVFAQASVGVFFEPARSAVIPNLVPARLLLAANGLAQTTGLAAGIAGSILAGALLATPAGPALAFGMDAMTFIVSASFVARLGPKPAIDRVSTSARRVGADLREGLRCLFGSRVLVGIVAAFWLALLGIGAFNALLVPYLMKELHAGSTSVGILRGLQMAGMVAGGAVLSTVAARARAAPLISSGLAALGAAVVVLAVARDARIAGLSLFVAGIAVELLETSAAAVLQGSVPDRLRGRVESALSTVLTVALMASMAAAGFLGDAIGMRRVFLLAGALTFAAGAAAMAILGGPAAEAPAHAPSPETTSRDSREA